MKSYKKLSQQLYGNAFIVNAIYEAAKGKRNRKEVQKILESLEDDEDTYIKAIKNYCHNFKHSNHKPKTIYDGISKKQRTILVPTFYEQVVHHLIVAILAPIFQKSMYYHSYGSLPNKGVHKAKKAMERWIQNDYKNTKYCLKMDIKKYFESIPHDILISKIHKIIKDKEVLRIVDEIIAATDKGIPLGFYTSQWFANFYLTDLDYYIKQKLGAKYYVRYMDDMVILGGNKRKLHKMQKAIDEYLHKELGLTMKENWQVFPIKYIGKDNKEHGRCIDFMGFKFSRYNTVLRRQIMLKASRKAKKIYKSKKPTIYACKQMLAYKGWISATDTYNYFLTYIKPYVTFRKLRKRISNYDRRQAKLCGTKQNIVRNRKK